MVAGLNVYVLNYSLLFAQNEIPSMDNSWDDSETGEKDVDKEIASTSLIKKNRDWRKEERKNCKKNLTHPPLKLSQYEHGFR